MRALRSLFRPPIPRWWRRLAGPRALDVVALGGGRYRAVGPDPQFIFAPPRSGGRFSLYCQSSRADGVEARVYFDWGEGFAQIDSVGLPAARAMLIDLDVAGCPKLCALRFDPFEDVGEFELRWSLNGELETRLDPTAPLARHAFAVRDYAPTRGDRPRAPRSAREHFDAVCALAAREFAGRYETPPAAPLISLVSPLYNTPPAYLDDLLASLRAQAPGYAELVLSDDGSTSAKTARWLAAHENEPGLTVVRGGVNRGIAAASNAGIAAARGDWIGFIDHDDALAPHAVAVLLRAIAQNPQARFFYTDELIADGKLRALDFFDKPAFDDVLLSGVNYINHLSLYRRDLIDAVGGFREGFDGSQDYDLLLRALARLKRDEIRHVPYPAYIWRRDGRSYSVAFLEKATANARRALGQAYGAPVAPALLKDLHRVQFKRARPKVSVIVPNRNAPKLMGEVADGLFARTDYENFELIVVDNGSNDPETLALYERLKRERDNFKLHMETAPFNFSAQINQGVKLAQGEAILLLNNDVEVLAPDWLAEMVDCLNYPDVGIVGARLLYPDTTLQHAGVVVGLGGLAGHWYIRRPSDFPGPMGRLSVRSAMTAVTGACMLISRACWDATGPFDASGFAVAYNDIDFCLRARAAGFRAVYTPFATLIHHESATRGPDAHGPNRPRFLRDQANLIERYGVGDFLDPVLSPWRSRDSSEPTRIVLDKLPGAR